jgi:hypothetical protein
LPTFSLNLNSELAAHAIGIEAPGEKDAGERIAPINDSTKRSI